MSRLVRVLELFTWIMMVITLIVAVLTTVVVFGIVWIPRFYNYILLEISLSTTLLLWGINTILSMQGKKSKRHGVYSIIFGVILLVFFLLGIY